MRIIYVINVDWFFDSHFAHLARRAKAEGYDVTIATHLTRDSSRYEDLGFRVVSLPPARGGMFPEHLIQSAARVAQELKNEKGSILHAFGLFGIGVGTLASLRTGHRRRVYSITGRGYSAVSRDAFARVIGFSTKEFCRRLADGGGTYWLAENSTDLEACGLERAVAEGRAAIVGGAGISPDEFRLLPMPPAPPLRFATVARMIWSKGIDTAVQGIRLARANGADVTLTLAGGIDRYNPKAWSEDDVRSLASEPGVEWVGHFGDIVRLWSEHHVALLPSRGGEGVPRSLIEAAACGRPFVTTDVPGCREFAKRCGTWAVAPDNPQGLAQVLHQVSRSKNLIDIGKVAREVVLDAYSEDQVWASAANYYSLLDDSNPKFERTK